MASSQDSCGPVVSDPRLSALIRGRVLPISSMSRDVGDLVLSTPPIPSKPSSSITSKPSSSRRPLRCRSHPNHHHPSHPDHRHPDDRYAAGPIQTIIIHPIQTIVIPTTVKRPRAPFSAGVGRRDLVLAFPAARLSRFQCVSMVNILGPSSCQRVRSSDLGDIRDHPRVSALISGKVLPCRLPIANCCSFRSVSSVLISGKPLLFSLCGHSFPITKY
jgi:hypothetical protein